MNKKDFLDKWEYEVPPCCIETFIHDLDILTIDKIEKTIQTLPYQRCPVCDNNGNVAGSGCNLFSKCPVCLGKMIIPMHVIK